MNGFMPRKHRQGVVTQRPDSGFQENGKAIETRKAGSAVVHADPQGHGGRFGYALTPAYQFENLAARKCGQPITT